MASRHPFEDTLGYRFADVMLLERALTHSSAPSQRGETNERLEFLGDRVLGLVVADALLKAFPGEDEGALARRLAALVSAPVLGRIAGDLDLARHLRVAAGHRLEDAETAVLADGCEAVIGAIYLDGGLEPARAFILSRWTPLLTADVNPPKDAKTALQEWAQGRGLPLPVYKVVEESGPAHAPSFVMTVEVEGQPTTAGRGRTKRIATQAAAAALLETLEAGGHD